MDDDIKREVSKRRTFAIISHPDAGKTTMTEKLLLYGGAIHPRGVGQEVPGPSSDRERLDGDRAPAPSSISTSVLAVRVRGPAHEPARHPGHNDFSEDTYRGPRGAGFGASCSPTASWCVSNRDDQATPGPARMRACRSRRDYQQTRPPRCRPPHRALGEIEEGAGSPAPPSLLMGAVLEFLGIDDRGSTVSPDKRHQVVSAASLQTCRPRTGLIYEASLGMQASTESGAEIALLGTTPWSRSIAKGSLLTSYRPYSSETRRRTSGSSRSSAGRRTGTPPPQPRPRLGGDDRARRSERYRHHVYRSRQHGCDHRDRV